jgi:hypothetical protein
MKKIETIHLFPELNSNLIQLLRDLEEYEWEIQSPIKGRTVKDLASHILDGSLRRLSIQRDNFADSSKKVEIKKYSDLVDFIQGLNEEWIFASRRLSPKILIDLLEYSEKQLYNFFTTLSPYDKALYPVAWAGETESENWFDIAREYTEKWHHQMQIRLAINRPLLMDKRYIEPLYDTFMLGLPNLYKDLSEYTIGETLKITLTGELNKSWFLARQSTEWTLLEDTKNIINTEIQFFEQDAWKIFTNTDRNKEKYKSRITITGDKKLGYRLFDLITVMS